MHQSRRIHYAPWKKDETITNKRHCHCVFVQLKCFIVSRSCPPSAGRGAVGIRHKHKQAALRNWSGVGLGGLWGIPGPVDFGRLANELDPTATL